MVATKINGPWPVFTPVVKKQRDRRKTTEEPVKKFDLGSLTISSDPIPETRSSPVSKYDSLFRQMKVGQCVVCDDPETASRVKAGLDKWLKNQGMKHLTSRAMSRYPKDGKGRVWLIEKGK